MNRNAPVENIAVVGLGYVGLPLAVAFARVMPAVLGFDVDERRVEELRKGHDRNNETSADELAAPALRLTTSVDDLAQADAFIVAVPTPVDRAKRPDLGALRSASRTVGAALAKRAARGASTPAIIVFESTVYPGCTEEECVPLIAQASGLPRSAFRVGYSPERINPGDKEHTLERIVKVVSGEDAATLGAVADLYSRVVKAGVYRAPDIRTAEAAKVIENTQRDLNIALMNELAILFHRMGIDTQEVLKAAQTKWNFLRFSPGLVGGHCIPEDPYYLTHKAESLGFHPQVILAGRRINDGMGAFVAHETVKSMIRAGRRIQGARVLVLGVAFKEDVKDTRNTRVVDMVRELESYGVEAHVHDPVVGVEGIERLGLRAVHADPFLDENASYDAVIIAVAHRAFRAAPPGTFARLARNGSGVGPIMDVKGILPRDGEDAASGHYWAL